MTEGKAARLVGGDLIRNRDGARWSTRLGTWVLPHSKQKGITLWTPAANNNTRLNVTRPSSARSKTGRYSLRIMLAESQNWRCCYCGIICHMHTHSNKETQKRDTVTIEHVHELSRGGSEHWDNLVMACAGCNNERGNLYTAEAFFLWKQKQLKRAFY